MKQAIRIQTDLMTRLRGSSAEAEAAGRLTAEQLSIIYRNGWFKLFVPLSYGGLELALPEAVRLEEELAYIDGSLGWTVTLCAGANLFVGYIDQALAPSIFKDPNVCLGGSGQASGIAREDRGGYRISGRWQYATGAPHLTHFTANCTLGETEAIKAVVLPRNEVHVHEDWNAFGLRATASHSFGVDDVWVDAAQVFTIAPEQATLTQPIYRYPFLQLAEATLAVNTLGMARHFLECMSATASGQGQEMAQVAADRLALMRVTFYETLDESWDELCTCGTMGPETLLSVSDRCRVAVKAARTLVMEAYPYAGLAAADRSTELNRIWRDLFTASQHSLLRG